MEGSNFLDLCPLDFLAPFNHLVRFAEVAGKDKARNALIYIHETINQARAMRFEQIVAGGYFINKVHNLYNSNPHFEQARVNYLVFITSPVKPNYAHYRLVV